MPKRSAPAIPANFDFVKNYLELKKLRDEVEFIERSRAGLVIGKPPSPDQSSDAFGS